MSLIGTRTRFGRIAKWIGLCVSVVTAAGTLPASGGVALWVTRTGGVHVGTVYGTAYVAWRTKPCPISGYSGFVPEPGWNTLWYAHSWDDYLRPASTRFMTAPRSGWTIPQHRYVSVPLWMLSLASAMPIIWLWRRDRRFSAGH
ncbi:MAG TPA: hypothetical protein VGM03_06620, partial [Phycisphaerae bacterium]